MGEMQFHVFFVLSFLAAGIAGFLAVTGWRHRTVRSAFEFSLLMVCISLWTFSIGWGMVASSPRGSFVWAVIRMAMVFATPVCWLVFALQFSDNAKWLTAPNIVLASLIPTVSLILMITTWRHGLFLVSIDYVQVGPYLIDQTWHLGPWFWFHLVYSYVLILIGDLLLLKEAMQVARLYQYQAIALIIGTVFPLATNIAYTFHLFPGLAVNYDSFGFVLAGFSFSFGLFHYRMFDLKPVARQLLIDSLGDGMLVLDEKLRIVDLNPAALKIFGTTEETLVGFQVDEKLSQYIDINTFLSNETEIQSELCIEREGKQFIYDLRCTKISKNNRKAGQLCILRDVTRRKNLEHELQALALTDSLTGLSNRRQFYQLAVQEFDRASRYHSPFSLLMIDLDDFKQVNDQYGHMAGDRVLQEISKILVQILRKSDLIFRYGGDEFAVLMPETGLEKGIQVCKRLGKAVSELTYDGLENVSITLSQGMALFDGYEDVTLDQLLFDADRALYAAKARGKNHLSISGMD